MVISPGMVEITFSGVEIIDIYRSYRGGITIAQVNESGSCLAPHSAVKPLLCRKATQCCDRGRPTGCGQVVRCPVIDIEQPLREAIRRGQDLYCCRFCGPFRGARSLVRE